MRPTAAITLCLGLSLLVAACGDRPDPAGPDLEDAALSGVSAEIDFGLASSSISEAVHSAALHDIRDRLLPWFTDEEAANRLSELLVALETALAAGETDSARVAIDLGRAIIDPAGDGSEITAGDRADIGVILLVLEQVEQSLLQ